MRQLPFDINDKIKQDLQTIGNNADPKMQVVVARAKSSIQDSSYFTVENIRTKAGLTDISVATRRQKSYGPPDGLFAIHLDNGVAKVLERAYPDKLNLKWQEVFQLGAAKAVAITFDGDWGRYRNSWNLVTEGLPYIFWVNNANTLYVQLWDDPSTRFELSDNVARIKALRGWKNAIIQLQDHGIIIGYIKTDGTVWYRSYSYQASGEQAWENARQVTEFSGVAIALNLFITNDYRTGFVIEDSIGQISWYITERNWGGMASPVEKLNYNIRDLKFEVLDIITTKTDSLEKLDVEIETPRFYVCPPIITPLPDLVSIERLAFKDNKTIELTFNRGPLKCDLVRLKKSMILETTAGLKFEIEDLRVSYNKLTITTILPMRLMDYMKLYYDKIDSYFLGFQIHETCVIDYGKIINITIPGAPPRVEESLGVFLDIQFTIIDVPTTKLNKLEKLDSTITDLTFTVTDILYTNLPAINEYLVSGVTNILFEVTMIGTSPL